MGRWHEFWADENVGDRIGKGLLRQLGYMAILLPTIASIEALIKKPVPKPPAHELVGFVGVGDSSHAVGHIVRNAQFVAEQTPNLFFSIVGSAALLLIGCYKVAKASNRQEYKSPEYLPEVGGETDLELFFVDEDGADKPEVIPEQLPQPTWATEPTASHPQVVAIDPSLVGRKSSTLYASTNYWTWYWQQQLRLSEAEPALC